jgi:hypothetical protein
MFFSGSVSIASLSYFFILYVISTGLPFDVGLAKVVLLQRRASAAFFDAPSVDYPPSLSLFGLLLLFLALLLLPVVGFFAAA